LARIAAGDAGEIFNGTAEMLPVELADRSFDAVLLSHVLEHCSDPSNAIRNALTLLSPTGTLVIEVPNSQALGFAMFGALWPWSDIPRHLNFFTESSLRALLSKHGLIVSSIKYVGYTRQFSAGWISKQNKIQAVLNNSKTNFDRAAWLLLLRSMFARAAQRYDSVRVHARFDDAARS